MASRALIIAIEDYPFAEDIAPKLDGTLSAVLQFKDWLDSKWQADNITDVQILLCTEPVQPGGRGATLNDIKSALLQLKQDGQNSTEELYVYFSGHGFRFKGQQGVEADTIICADFQNATLSGNLSLKLDEITNWLQSHMGPGHHYYFVDACRNFLSGTRIVPGTLSLPWDPQPTEKSTVYLLQSTSQGNVATIGGPFPGSLRQGLKGDDTAKTWDPGVFNAMVVNFDSLRDYLKQKITSQTADGNIIGEDEAKDAVFAVIQPIPRYKCSLIVKDGDPTDVGSVAIRRLRASSSDQYPLIGDSFEITLDPDHYLVTMNIDGAMVEPIEPVKVVLFKDSKLVFKKTPAAADPQPESLGPSPAPESGGGSITMRTASTPPDPASTLNNTRATANRLDRSGSTVNFVRPPMTEVLIENRDTNDSDYLGSTESSWLAQGRYSVTLRDERDGSIIAARNFEVGSEHPVALDFTWNRHSLPHNSIAERLPVFEHGPEFSESLAGPVTDTDLDVWLGILGGGRILGSDGRFSKMARFPLHDFEDQDPDTSSVYVLAGLTSDKTTLEVAVSDDSSAQWTEALEPDGMAGLRHLHKSRQPGPCLVSLRLKGGQSYTLASHCEPNHSTLITLSLDEKRDFSIYQYILPLAHLNGYLAPDIQLMVASRNQLQDLRYTTLLSRAFRKGRKLADVTKTGLHQHELQGAQWIDPVASSATGYRSLVTVDQDTYQVVDKLMLSYPSLPDVTALQRLIDMGEQPWNGTPLFMDGLRAFPDFEDKLPLASGLLDWSGPWTAWVGAIE